MMEVGECWKNLDKQVSPVPLSECRFVPWTLSTFEPIVYRGLIEKVRVTKTTIRIKAWIHDSGVPALWFIVKPDGSIVPDSMGSWLSHGRLYIGGVK